MVQRKESYKQKEEKRGPDDPTRPGLIFCLINAIGIARKH